MTRGRKLNSRAHEDSLKLIRKVTEPSHQGWGYIAPPLLRGKNNRILLNQGCSRYQSSGCHTRPLVGLSHSALTQSLIVTEVSGSSSVVVAFGGVKENRWEDADRCKATNANMLWALDDRTGPQQHQ